MKSITHVLAVTTLSAMIASPAFAGGEHRHHEGKRVHEHHQKMLEACEGKSDGDSVTLTARNGESIEAICTLRPATLVAVPTRHLEHKQAMKDACAGKVEGDIVAFTNPSGDSVTGTCTSRHGELFAKPEHKRKGDKKKDQ